MPTIEGLDALFTLKKRPPTKPVSLAVTSLEQAAQLVHVPHEIMALEAAFPKGSMTFVLPAIKPLAPRLGGSSIAVRCVAHPLALALVETGDQIRLDVPNRRLELLVPDDEIESRRANWQPPATVKADRGYKKLYMDQVNQAGEGVDFNFMTKRPFIAKTPIS